MILPTGLAADLAAQRSAALRRTARNHTSRLLPQTSLADRHPTTLAVLRRLSRSGRAVPQVAAPTDSRATSPSASPVPAISAVPVSGGSPMGCVA